MNYFKCIIMRLVVEKNPVFSISLPVSKTGIKNFVEVYVTNVDPSPPSSAVGIK